MSAGITTLGGDYTIHLTYRPNGLDEGDVWLIACNPTISNFRSNSYQPNYLRSNDTRAVTCAECRKTRVFEEVRKKETP